MNSGRMQSSVQTDTLADILERVLDKGVVIAGDVTVSLVGVELLNIKLRLLIASVDKAMEMGINWWAHDPYLSVGATGPGTQTDALTARIDRLEAALVGATGSGTQTDVLTARIDPTETAFVAAPEKKEAASAKKRKK